MIRVWVFLVFVLCSFCANATTVCSRNDKVVIGLGYMMRPTSVVADNDTFEWRAFYDGLGTISGIASCTNLERNGPRCAEEGFSEYFGCSYEKYGQDTNANYQGNKSGRYCWCKITHPFESKWVFEHIYTDECATKCASHCAGGNGIKSTDSKVFRKGIFFTVGMDE